MSFEGWLAAQSASRAASGLQRRLTSRPVSGALVDLAGNDYLGLGRDVRVTAAAAEAAARWGAGAGASRLVTGSLELHAELEAALAAFTGRDAALVFSTGYLANLGVIASLAGPDALVVSDAHVHASLVDGCRLARAGRLVVVPHNDVEAVDRALVARTTPRALVVVESVYSVLGDAAPLTRLAEVCSAADALLVVDEAHAIGVTGPGGRGQVHAHGLSARDDVVSTITLSKSLASQGGAVLGSAALVDHLVNTARPFIYDTGLAPASTAAAREALRIVAAEPGLPHRALQLARSMASALAVDPPAGSVLSVAMASPEEALRVQSDLADDGYLVGCFRPPSVPEGISRLRLTARASLTDDQAAEVMERLADVRSDVAGASSAR